MNLSFHSITSKSNSHIVQTAKYADKKYRDANGVFVCEGIKLLKEAVIFGADVREIYMDEEADSCVGEELHSLLDRCPDAERYKISHELYRRISSENAPQGILAVIGKTSNVRRLPSVVPSHEETVMLLEAVRDPGNLGTLIRTAAAFGLDRLILSADCADVFNPKTLRGAMGAIFKIKLDYCDDLVTTLETLNSHGRRTLAALPRKSALVAGKDPLLPTDCVVIGNEGHGLSATIVAACSDAVYIPMNANTESLNAAIASAILMWEIVKSK